MEMSANGVSQTVYPNGLYKQGGKVNGLPSWRSSCGDHYGDTKIISNTFDVFLDTISTQHGASASAPVPAGASLLGPIGRYKKPTGSPRFNALALNLGERLRLNQTHPIIVSSCIY